jgi:nitric oxide dioxygenase
MTPEEIKLVRATFARLEPHRGQVAEMFYRRLFEIAPHLKPLFKTDMTDQGAKVMGAIAVAVAGLHRLDEILPQVEDMGRRHRGYGVEPGHYNLVGDAFLWTLDQGLGEAFTPEVRAAWIGAYRTLAGAMIAAGTA